MVHLCRPAPRRTRSVYALLAAVTSVLLLAAGCGSSPGKPSASPTTPGGSGSTASPSSTSAAPNRLPVPDHVVVLIEENHTEASILGNPDAPYFNGLAHLGASFTRSYAITHPSQPNYLALFSGSTQGVTDDACPPPGSPYTTANLASSLSAAHRTFVGYSEGLPSAGPTACTNGAYARKHNPWVDFSNTAASSNQPFTAFPSDYSQLPTVSFVVPDLQHDMHDGTIRQADTWARQNLDGYLQWAFTHNSLLVVTWDEDDSGGDNQIPTFFVGPMVRPGDCAIRIDHYEVLRTLESMYGAAPSGKAAATTPIEGCWR